MHMGDLTDSSTQCVGVIGRLLYTGKQHPLPTVATEQEAAWAPELVLDCFAEEIWYAGWTKF